jgi:hypothetical protein
MYLLLKDMFQYLCLLLGNAALLPLLVGAVIIKLTGDEREGLEREELEREGLETEGLKGVSYSLFETNLRNIEIHSGTIS